MAAKQPLGLYEVYVPGQDKLQLQYKLNKQPITS